MSVLTKMKECRYPDVEAIYPVRETQEQLKRADMLVDLCTGFYTEYLDGSLKHGFVGLSQGQLIKFCWVYFGCPMGDDVRISGLSSDNPIGTISYHGLVIAHYYCGPENIPFFVFTDNYDYSWTKSSREHVEEKQRLALAVIRDYQLYLNPPPKPKSLMEVWEERGEFGHYMLGLS